MAFDGTCDDWLTHAASAIAERVEPGAIFWNARDAGLSLLTSDESFCSTTFATLPPLFVRLARSVSCHRDPHRWDALYSVLWRLCTTEPQLLNVVTDPMVHRLVQMHRAVKRASHKMKAFVRFRRIGDEDESNASYIAWFEPVHAVVERTAPFFARRFPSMRWSILTPERCAHWDRSSLRFSEGVSRNAAPNDDDLEELWRTYYANIFNPARLNGRAMRQEMAVRYWKNMPETTIISDLRANASRRVEQMLAQVFAEPETIPQEFLPTEADRARLATLDMPGTWDAIHDPSAAASRRRALAVADHPRFVPLNDTRVDLGVAGWTDPTILAPGVFYPAECTSAEQRLRFYASRYSMVEVDATYYALPTRAMATAWASRTPDDFTFDVKAHALMTGHPTDVRRLPDWIRRELPRERSSDPRIYNSDLPRAVLDEVWSRFRDALTPLRTANKLGAIMLQFPRWFTPTRQSADTLRRAKTLLGDDLATIEFRNRAWMEGRIAERTIALLKELELSYVVVDAPPGTESSMPPTVAITDSRLVVFRLHGRRVATWEAKNDPVTERYRYLYDDDELRWWLPYVRETAFNVARVHLTFNNNHSNYATTNAAEFAQILRES
ncbi:MAG TPA: TIGR03915 family putative DNA repair protein [Gemmatimonadaceae bacterium]|jgi:probable DNA metabolism protein